MKSKHLFAAVLMLAIIAVTGAFTAKAAEEQTGLFEQITESDKEISKIAEVISAEELIEVEEPEVAAGAEVKEVKWNDNFNKKDLMYMSSIIYCEAGGMSRDAKIAVGNVIINRMRDKKDWAHVSTVKEVIYDRKWGVQFSPTSSGAMAAAIKIYKNKDDYKGTWRYDYMVNCIEAAKAVFCGEKTIPDSYLYFNGYIDSSVSKCKNAGKSYIIMQSHIYF